MIGRDEQPTSDTIARWHRAVDERDRAFDGLFFVAIKSTRIYCRPVCPSRLARRENRRFFPSQSEAEVAGYRACKRCRPELAPGHAPVDALPRCATELAARISAGELDARSVREVAQELQVSDRHLRRATSRALGESPVRLALANRLRIATRLLVETRDPITFVAYSSGFRSLRRFNAAFRDRFQMSPSEWRRQSPRG